MKFQELISRSFSIAFKNKFLWFFGFFLAFGDFAGNKDHPKIQYQIDSFNCPVDLSVPLIILFVFAALLIVMALMFFGVVSVGALISSVKKIDDGKPVIFSEAFMAGLKKFWHVIGLVILFIIIVVALVIIIAVPVVVAIISLHIVLKILFGIAAALLFFPIGILVWYLYTYGVRYIVLENTGVIESISKGWKLFVNNLKYSFIGGLVGMLLNILFTMFLAALFVFLLFPFGYVYYINHVAGLVSGITISVAIFAIIIGWWGTFLDGFWTLFFCKLKEQEQS